MVHLKFLTWNTAVLFTLLASASKRGEVHALNAAKFHPDRQWLYAILEPHSKFVGKMELQISGASRLSALEIPDLGLSLSTGKELDRLLWPVWV